jgi:putative holliday junction resolvase
MARILCIDYGGKRTGLAVTDELQIIATPLTTVETKHLMQYLEQYCKAEKVEKVLIGYPLNWDDTATHATPMVNGFIKAFEKKFPITPIEKVDERFSSKLAQRSMVEMGMKKKQRQVKGNVDQIAATLLLQEYLANQ